MFGKKFSSQTYTASHGACVTLALGPSGLLKYKDTHAPHINWSDTVVHTLSHLWITYDTYCNINAI